MKILQVNKFHYNRGGADKYYLELSESLRNSGHQVANFSMEHPNNIESEYSKYFVSRLSFNEGSFIDKIKTPARVIYSLEAKRKFRKLVEDFSPDIVHIHNIYHQISPSILDVAREFKIPVVMHLHDYKLICPNYQLFAHGKICEACKPNSYINCLKKKCFKNSYTKSALASLEMYIHHSCLKIYKKNISLFIAPSQFMKNKVAEFGWDRDKIKVIINPFSPQLQASDNEIKEVEKENYLLYFGRLSKEKGINTLIHAASKTGEKVKIAGVGSEKENLEKLAKELNTSVEFLGFKKGNELKNIILKAKAVVIPSIWYENMPLSMLEALNLGSPVIASNIGGMPEIVKEGENGYLFDYGNSNDLASKIEKLNKSNINKLIEGARESVKHLSSKDNSKEVLEVYTEILSNK